MENFFSIYSFVYIPLIFSIFIEKKNTQRIAMIFWIIIFTLFRGLRWDCGTDWDWYESSFYELDFDNFYKYITIEGEDGNIKMLEAGWALLMVISKYIYAHYSIFLLVSNALLMILIYKISTALSLKPIQLFVYILCVSTFFPVRQDFAVLLLLYGFILFDTKQKLSIFIFVLAGFFHKSAWLIIPLFLLCKLVRFKKNTYLISIILCVLFSQTMVKVLIPLLPFVLYAISPQLGWMADEYLIYEAGRTEGLHWANIILNICFIGLFFKYLVYQKTTRLSVKIGNLNIVSKEYQYMNMFVLGILIQLLFLQIAPSLARMSSYCAFAVAVLYDNMLTSCNKNKIYSTLLLYFVVYMIYLYIRHFDVYPELHFPYKHI